MVRISEELVRRRAEHNDGILHSLRELTLHQFEIEKIELLGTLCRHLQILYLQNNLIGKIENLGRLKELEYLNLAVNNIQVIEGLDRCESLQKLDLTLNFIGISALEHSCDNLVACSQLRELYLLGNPLTSFPDWRLFVIAKVPQLESIDSVDITKTERILSRQRLPQLQRDLHAAVAAANSDDSSTVDPALTKHTPEERTKMYRELAAAREERERGGTTAFDKPSDPIEEANKKMAMLAEEGEDGQLPRQRNQGQWRFMIDDDDDQFVVATIKAPKYLETTQISVDVHPYWFQCLIKGKNLLLHLPVEVSPSQTNIQRVITTGDLIIKMARVQPLNRKHRAAPKPILPLPQKSTAVDIRNIVKSARRNERIEVDDSDVPPLE